MHAIPGLFPPVEIGGQLLIDGSAVADGPLGAAEALGATTIYLLPTATPSDTITCDSAFDVAARAMFLPAYRLAMATSTTLASRLDVHVLPPPSMTDHSLINFRATAELIDRSYLQARAWVADRHPVLAA